jgi:hypothetical protein
MAPLEVHYEITGIKGASAQGVNPTDVTVFKGKALFAGPGIDGLWVTDGTAAGTHELTGTNGASANGLQPTDLTVFGKEVLFAGVDASVTLPKIQEAKDAVTAAAAIADGVASGELTPSEAAELSKVVENYARALQ